MNPNNRYTALIKRNKGNGPRYLWYIYYPDGSFLMSGFAPSVPSGEKNIKEMIERLEKEEHHYLWEDGELKKIGSLP